jgi:hypothetical protein
VREKETDNEEDALSDSDMEAMRKRIYALRPKEME